MSEPIPQLNPIPWKPLDPKTARECFDLYLATEGPEPSLSVILSMLCYKGAVEGIHGHPQTNYRQSIIYWRRSFFTTCRVQRILRAVIDGEAGDEVVKILQDHLNEKGFYTAGTVGFWMAFSGWMKQAIINCFDPKAWRSFKKANGFPKLAAIYSRFDLAQLLKIPLRDLSLGEGDRNE